MTLPLHSDRRKIADMAAESGDFDAILVDDSDYAFQLQMQEVMTSTLPSSSRSPLSHNQKFVAGITGIDEEWWKKYGDNYHKPYVGGASSSSSSGVSECFRVYSKGLASEEYIREMRDGRRNLQSVFPAPQTLLSDSDYAFQLQMQEVMTSTLPSSSSSSSSRSLPSPATAKRMGKRTREPVQEYCPPPKKNVPTIYVHDVIVDDDDAYSHIKFSVKDVRYPMPFFSSMSKKSPIDVAWEKLGALLSKEERDLCNLVCGSKLGRDSIIFQDGNTLLRKWQAESAFGRNGLHIPIVNAYCDLLHRRQMEEKNEIKRLYFPLSLSGNALEHVKAGTNPTPNGIKREISEIMRAVPGVEKEHFTGNRCEYYFFPHVRDMHYVAFCIDMRVKKFIYLNSLGACVGFEKDKDSMKRVLKYFITYMRPYRPDVVWTDFRWEVARVIEQADNFNCGVFLIWYMEHWSNGGIPDNIQSRFIVEKNLAHKRKKVLAAILMQQENMKLEELRGKLKPRKQ